MNAIHRRGGRYPGYPIRPFGSFHLAFGGVDEFVDITGAQLGIDVASSVALWFRVPATASPLGLWNESSAGFSRRHLQIQADGSILYVISATDDSTPLFIATTTTGLDNNQWHFVVLTERGNRNARIYVDGVDILGPIDHAGPAVVTTTAASFGRRPTGGGAFDRYLIGDIAHAAVWTRELSAGDVTNLYNRGIDWDWRLLASGRPRNEWWFGEDDTFPTLTDRGSGPAVNGTASNMEAADVRRDSP